MASTSCSDVCVGPEVEEPACWSHCRLPLSSLMPDRARSGLPVAGVLPGWPCRAVPDGVGPGALRCAPIHSAGRRGSVRRLPIPTLLPIASRLLGGPVMNCLTCSSSDVATPAIGSCTSCGAGVCAGHTRIDAHERTHGVTLGIHTPHVVRALICPTCATVTEGSQPLSAETAAS
jgi:hypothetical protein